MQDQDGEFQVRVGDAAQGVGKANKVVHDVLRPREAPHIMLPIAVEVKPNTPCPKSGGVSVSEIRSQAVDYFR